MNSSLYTPFAIGETINQLLVKSQVTGVNCQCAGSLVVLRGQVSSKKSKERAASIARRCCGMNEISNEIHVVS
jgi:osmotically-inducible protein OsmY